MVFHFYFLGKQWYIVYVYYNTRSMVTTKDLINDKTIGR